MKSYILENWKEVGLFEGCSISETSHGDFVILRYPLRGFGLDVIYPKTVSAAKAFVTKEVVMKKGIRCKWKLAE